MYVQMCECYHGRVVHFDHVPPSLTCYVGGLLMPGDQHHETTFRGLPNNHRCTNG